MTLVPGQHKLVVYAGADFDELLVWRDGANALVNLTGYSARMMARTIYAAPTPFMTLTTGAGITLGGVAGTIRLFLPAAQTVLLEAQTGVYDLELIDGAGGVQRLLQGFLVVSPEVTR